MKRKTAPKRGQNLSSAQRRYIKMRTALGLAVQMTVTVIAVALIVLTRLRLTHQSLFDTNRTRIQTVLAGLEAGVTEKESLYDEYDKLYTAKLENTAYYYRDFVGVALDDAFARQVGQYAGVESVAVIDSGGRVYGAWQCAYDFSRNRFNMLRACARTGGDSVPFSIAYSDGTKRFYGKSIGNDRILVFVQDWTRTAENIANMTSWEAVLRGMVSVDTVSIAVSMQDHSFLYNPIGDLTGRDALQNGLPVDALGGHYEGELTFGGEEWCAVGEQWGDAMIYVMTRARTDMANDGILILFVSVLFTTFVCLVAAYGIILNRDNIRMGKMPSYITLLHAKDEKGRGRHLLNFNLSVAGKLLPVALAGIVVVTAVAFYLQSVNALASIAYEANMAVAEIGTKLENNTRDAEAMNTEYKETFLSKCAQIAAMLEENPRYVLNFDPEAENIHIHPAGRSLGAGKDAYGNPAYALSQQAFLQRLCDLNAIETISVFDDEGRILATSGDGWYFTLQSDPASQSYPFWEILAGHHDFCAQDLALDDEGQYAQYIGNAFEYYTTQAADGSTAYVSRGDYEQQRAGGWEGAPITRHHGVLQLSIAPERLRAVMETATLNYVAGHTTVHGAGHITVCDASDAHRCLYSVRSSDIGKSAAAIGYSANAFNAGGEMYNGYETVDGVEYFQTFKLVSEYGYYIGASVPLATVFATRSRMALTTFLIAFFGLLGIFVYTCTFGEREERMYRATPDDEDWHLRNEQDFVILTMPSGKKRRARTAASRWDAEDVPWAKMTPEQKFAAIVKAVFYLIANLLFACILLSRSGIAPIAAIDYIYEGVWSRGFNIFAMTNCVITLIVAFVLANVIDFCIGSLCANIGSRAETLGNLFSSVVRYGVALFALFYTLYLCGLDTGSLIASAGIMSLVIGLGAQSMIQDILAGVFIVFEGAFRVGDIVTIGDFRGNVLEIGLRTTKIEDAAKNIKVFNNSTLSGIINMTKEASFASVDIGVAYDTDLERLEAILAEELPQVAKRLPAIMEGPSYRGVSELGQSSVNIKIVAKCKEQDRIQLCRDLNREMFLIFNRYGITIPFPQVTVSYLDQPGDAAPAAPQTEATDEETTPAGV